MTADLAVDPARVRELLDGLVEAMAAEGAIRSPEWRAVFGRVPRHAFIPRFYRRGESGREPVDGAQTEQYDEWLTAVYRDDSLVIQYEPSNPELATSSSSQPTLMAIMLEALDVVDGSRVLEIGTGSGYNAALLCERLGSTLVTTIDVEPTLVEAARQRLAAAGYTPTVVVADGVTGYKANAPYDRIIATCAVATLPKAWIDQAREGTVIVATLSSGVVRLVVGPDGSATGRFISTPAYFMQMKGTMPLEPPMSELIELTKGSGTTKGVVVPPEIGEESFWFLAELAFMPSVVLFGVGGPTIYDGLRIVDLCDRSWARIDRDGNGHSMVTQAGVRKLWDEVESAYTLWERLGKPDRDRFGLTVTPDRRQYLWLDDPDRGHRWELHLS